MSIITVQFGQCGNQVGFDWYTTLGQESGLSKAPENFRKKRTYGNQSSDRWFYSSQNEQKIFARSVLVDTEQKVINNICKNVSATQMWEYNPESVVCEKNGGSGNNWALGYCQRGPEMEEAVLDSVRKEAENCDWLCSFHYILGCAGGTGSGLGSRLISYLQDEFPSKYIVNSLIFPYKGGEIITQNYNVILTLAKIYDVSDVHVIFQNDDLHKIHANIYGQKRVELQDINSLISLKLSSFLQPVCDDLTNNLPTIISNLTPHPCYKMVSINSAPHDNAETLKQNTSTSWNALLKHIRHSLYCSGGDAFDVRVKNTKHSNENLFKDARCVANVLITRGNDYSNLNSCRDFHLSDLYPDWIPLDSRFYHYHHEQSLLNYNKFVSLISNNSSVYDLLDNFLHKGWTQFSQKAYLHQYTKYEMEEEDISAAFLKIEDTSKHYKELRR